MMKWTKKGLVLNPADYFSWGKNSALQPSAILKDENTIRVYLGLRDDDGVSRIGYCDLDAADPSTVISFSEHPVLNIGDDGNFDDNGVVPCCVVQHNDEIYLYYAGYQLVKKVRFLVFGGLAISKDKGETFQRVQKTPVVDRTDDETLFKVIHTALKDAGKWTIWYGGGSSFLQGQKKTLPQYDIRTCVSEDGIAIPTKGGLVLPTSNDEYRIARPNVIKTEKGYHMFLCHGSEEDPYSLGYAFSKDGKTWRRDDDYLNLTKSSGRWDSDMMAYPCFVRAGHKSYLFYNGNEYGRYGFGYAELQNPDVI